MNNKNNLSFGLVAALLLLNPGIYFQDSNPLLAQPKGTKPIKIEPKISVDGSAQMNLKGYEITMPGGTPTTLTAAQLTALESKNLIEQIKNAAEQICGPQMDGILPETIGVGGFFVSATWNAEKICQKFGGKNKTK